MDFSWDIVNDQETFARIVENVKSPVALDIETRGLIPALPSSKLLGISLSCSDFVDVDAIYVPIWMYDYETSEFKPGPALDWAPALASWIEKQSLVGHNFTFDKKWIDHEFSIESKWRACTRIMWHLASAPKGPHQYGLKQAQKEVLEWPASNEKELELEVQSRGGKLKSGDHYLATTATLAKYAALDAYATINLYTALEPFFVEHDYFWFLEMMMQYNLLLTWNTELGVKVDVPLLEEALRGYEGAKDKASQEIREICKTEIEDLERVWKAKREKFYKSPRGRALFLEDCQKWPKFNPSSDEHLRQLYYQKLGFPILAYTKPRKSKNKNSKPKPKIDRIYLKNMPHPVTEKVLAYNKAEKIAGYAAGYLKHIRDSRLHFSFNICGTVSYRLSGFSPNIQQAPFTETELMSPFVPDEGYVGIHADLSGAEPCVTAHYSEDPTLLKVYRDGLGDVYLDLARELFPENKELQEQYDPYAVFDPALKSKFKDVRNIGKTIHLALQYTGTEYTVARNLSLNGYPTTPPEASKYVNAYWKKFNAVDKFSYRLRELNREQGYLRTLSGRIIRVPDPEYKDLMNRFVQAGAHDALQLWVLEIDRLRRERGIDMKPMILDTHDATSWQVKEEQYEDGVRVYEDALGNINSRLGLCVTLRCDVARFDSFAGLKGD